jgi:serine/threonine protein phosphatase PrpC
VEDLVQNHRISASLGQKIDQATKSEDLNNEELFIFNQRNIVTAALSQEFKETDIYLNEVELSEFKMLALTTDGVHDNITDNDIKTLLIGSKVGGDAAKNLVEFAHEVSLQNTLRSKPDDITAVIIDL